MMFCTKCGNQLPEDARFCTGCGNSVAAAQAEDQAIPQFQQYGQTYQQTHSRGTSVNYEDIKTKIKATYRKAVGADFEQGEPAPEYEKHPHPYHSLGGWLGFIAYAQVVAAGLLTILCFIGFITLARVARYYGASGGWFAFVQFAEFVGLGFTAFIGIKFFLMIRGKDPRFLRFYELMTIVCASVYVLALVFTGFRNLGGFFGNIIGQAVAFAIWSAYFTKSVRVRTYFGSDEYLRRSIFFKNAVAPRPADTEPYVVPQPYMPQQPY